MLRTSALFRRLPRWRWRSKPQPLIRAELLARFPDYQDDFQVLTTHVERPYARLDEQAGRNQNRARLLGCLQLTATTLLSLCAGVHLVMDQGATGAVLRIAGVIFGLVVGVVGQVNRTSPARATYLSARRGAEQLRTLCWLYLGKQGIYADPATRQRSLCQAVLRIEQEARANG